jgi:uncharacterized protein (TIGR03118 family)
MALSRTNGIPRDRTGGGEMKRTVSLASLIALCLAVIAGTAEAVPSGATRAARAGNAYRIHRLVSDQAGHAKNVDANLVNAWGLAAGPQTPWWVNAADHDVSTLYDGTGAVQPLVVTVSGGPTGIVFNGGSNFTVSDSGGSGGGGGGGGGGWPARSSSGPSLFLFATESGQILGWNPGVPPPSPSTHSFVVADRSGVDAKYKGLAIDSIGAGTRLYATDFHNGRVDVFDGSFTLMNTSTSFVDPNLPAGYGPFGIQTIGDTVFVTYAKQDADAEDEVAGAGLGFVDAFDLSGTFVSRVASRGALNAPWGLAMAPDGFGRFGGDLLVGNFGDGSIHAFVQTAGGSWMPDGVLRLRPRHHHHRVLRIDGLWGIAFGNDDAAGPSTTLYFAAGPADETHGLFGSITAVG